MTPFSHPRVPARSQCRFALTVLILAAGLTAATPAIADDAEEIATLREEVRALRQEIRDLRPVSASDTSDTGVRASARMDLDEATRRALPDAQSRDTFGSGATTAGYDGGFFLGDTDGNYRLNVGGLLQVRYTSNFRDEPAVGDDDYEAGFTIHRARLKFDGFAGDPGLRYFIQLDANRNTGDLFLLDAFVDFDLSPAGDVTARAGRFKAPFLREQLAGAGDPLAVERSLVHGVFTAGRTEGVALYTKQPGYRIALSLNDGVGAAPSDFNNDNSEIAATARLDLKAFGEWNQLNDFAAFDGDEPSLFIGAAAHYELGERGEDTVNNDFFLWTVDGSYEVGPFNLFAAVVGRHDNPDFGDASEQYGYLAQIGYMAIPDRLQPFARYEHLDLAPGSSPGSDDVNLITAGFNWFFRGHTVQFSFDAVYVLDPLPTGSGALGLLPTADDDQLVLRAQFQVGF